MKIRDTNLKVNNKLWLISDTHFGHDNIIKFQQRPKNHEIIMLSEWIWAVKEDDQILHLGDVFMGKQGNPGRWGAIVSRLPGEKFLILGNHDKKKQSFYEDCGFTIIDPFIATKNNGISYFFTHRPVTADWPHTEYIDRDWTVNIHGHIHGNTYEHISTFDGEVDSSKRYINVSVEVMDYKPRQLGNIWND